MQTGEIFLIRQFEVQAGRLGDKSGRGVFEYGKK
jgi:predicted RecA/RadA family phage recombinase